MEKVRGSIPRQEQWGVPDKENNRVGWWDERITVYRWAGAVKR